MTSLRPIRICIARNSIAYIVLQMGFVLGSRRLPYPTVNNNCLMYLPSASSRRRGQISIYGENVSNLLMLWKIDHFDLSTFYLIPLMNVRVRKFNSCSPLSFRRRVRSFLSVLIVLRSSNEKNSLLRQNYTIYF